MCTFYCDESGNTGNNYLDIKDPFFILGGWLIEESFNKVKWENCLGENEYKANKLLKNVKGRRKIKEILEFLLNERAIPFLAIVDKKYALSARMVDVLLDPEYNDKIPRSITRDEFKISKKELANMFYKLDDEVIQEFAIAYRQLNSVDMEICIKKIVKELSDKHMDEIAYYTGNSIHMIGQNLYDEVDCKKNQAPNVFTLYTLMFLINNYASKNEISIYFVHDNQKEYSDELTEVTSLMLKERNELIRYAFEEQLVFFNKITNFKLDDSKENSMIQGADILVGSVNYLLKKLSKKEILDETEKDILKLLWNFITSWYNPQLTHFMIDDSQFDEIDNYVNEIFQNDSQ